MSLRTRFVLLAASLVSLSLAASASAAPPWQTLFKKVDADPAKSYDLTEQNGPWMILCTTFAGAGSEREAQNLVIELRKQYKLNAYTHKQHYDFTQKEAGLGLDKYGKPKVMRPTSGTKFDEIAVIVGDFPAIDDPKLQKTLEQLKYLQPECLKSTPVENSTRRYDDLRETFKRMTNNGREKNKGPMGKAFATRNPLLPAEFFAPKGLDALVREMNEGVEHGLLKCPGRYTVQIARFTGAVTIDQGKIRDLEAHGGKPTSRLEEAALKAHKMTEELRRTGVEAYEFHDREASIVTIGSFDSVGTPRADGKTEINPSVYRLMQDYGPQKVQLAGHSGLQPKLVAGIPCDVQPLPVLVPRVSIAADYAQSERSLR